MRVWLRLLALVPLAACGFLRDPVGIEGMQTQYGVHSLLMAGADSVTVIVVRYPAGAPSSHPGLEVVEDATVRVIAGADTLALTLGGAACGQGYSGEPGLRCYRTNVPGGIVAGAAYGLIVDIPDFGRITGATRIPELPIIVSPIEGARVDATHSNNALPTLPLRVDVPTDARRVTVAMIAQTATGECGANFIPNPFLVLDASASGVLRSEQFGAGCYSATGPQPLGELPVAIRAVSYDAEFAKYAEYAFDQPSESILESHARAGIDRGVGYFAGAAVAVVNVVMTGGGT